MTIFCDLHGAKNDLNKLELTKTLQIETDKHFIIIYTTIIITGTTIIFITIVIFVVVF